MKYNLLIAMKMNADEANQGQSVNIILQIMTDYGRLGMIIQYLSLMVYYK